MSGTVWTQTDVEKLAAAIATGVLTVRYDGPPKREITYQDLPAMRALLAQMRSELARAAGGKSYTLAKTSKGF
jgi:hypothetical protein